MISSPNFVDTEIRAIGEAHERRRERILRSRRRARSSRRGSVDQLCNRLHDDKDVKSSCSPAVRDRPAINDLEGDRGE